MDAKTLYEKLDHLIAALPERDREEFAQVIWWLQRNDPTVERWYRDHGYGS